MSPQHTPQPSSHKTRLRSPPIPGFTLYLCPCRFPHWRHPLFLLLYLYFILDGSLAEVPNTSQSHLMTQPIAQGGFLYPLTLEALITAEEMVQGAHRDREGGNLGQRPPWPQFRDTLSRLCSPCRLGGVFELSPISFCQLKYKAALWNFLTGSSLPLSPGGMTVKVQEFVELNPSERQRPGSRDPTTQA